MFSHLRPTSILIMLTAASVACASTGRNWSDLLQAAPTERHSGVIPGSREKIEALRPGSPLVVTLKSGDRLEGGLKAVGPAVLALTDRAGKELDVPLSEVASIVAPAAADGITNGAAIGAGIGLAAAVAVLAALGSQDGYVLPSAKVGAPLLLSGVGALVGVFVDRSLKSEQLLYLAR